MQHLVLRPAVEGADDRKRLRPPRSPSPRPSAVQHRPRRAAGVRARRDVARRAGDGWAGARRAPAARVPPSTTTPPRRPRPCHRCRGRRRQRQAGTGSSMPASAITRGDVGVVVLHADHRHARRSPSASARRDAGSQRCRSCAVIDAAREQRFGRGVERAAGLASPRSPCTTDQARAPVRFQPRGAVLQEGAAGNVTPQARRRRS